MKKDKTVVFYKNNNKNGKKILSTSGRERIQNKWIQVDINARSAIQRDMQA